MDKISAVLPHLHGHRVYVDTNIFIYFLERHERYFDAVVPFFQLFNAGLSLAYTGDAVVAETMYKPYQAGNVERVNEFKAFFNNDEFITVLPHSTKAFEMAAELSPKRGMKLIDALHYSTASLAGCTFILTNDVGFSSSKQIEVLNLQSLV
jgi:predicted nucleic acid-binding protein